MVNLELKYEQLLKKLKGYNFPKIDLAIILGSGLGGFAESVNTIRSIETTELPGYPESTVEGHKGFIHFAEYENKNILLFQGRIHFYEGYRLSDCVVPVYISHKLNCDKLILTNAAGGINPNLSPGDLMLVTSVNSIFLKKELTEFFGIASLKQKHQFLDFPSSEIMSAIKKASLEEKIFLKEGVYWFVKGPSYETPAEIRMISKSGGDAVGMSTAHEGIYAASLGMHVGAISCITNYAAGISEQKLSHNEVIETGNKVKLDFERLIKRIIKLI